MSTATSTDRIEKTVILHAPQARVWRAIADAEEFGTWFRVRLESAFAEGATVRGRITYPGYEHLKWEATVQKIEPERLFSFTWPQSKSLDSPDYTNAPTTLVEFRLEKTLTGTLLTLTESGFDKLPPDWRLDAFRRNDGGWTEQMKNIEKHVAAKP